LEGIAVVYGSQILIDDPPDYVGDKRMEFHLIYDGGLLKSVQSSKRRTWEKHAVRNFFHSQIKRLWETHPALQYYGNKVLEWEHKPPKPFLEDLAERHSRGGLKFIPLITEANGLVCSLEILFLRSERPGMILERGGDIDNRLKVLVDSLRLPKADEMHKKTHDDPDPSPMYVLMEDDKLITGLSVKTDRLLYPMGNSQNDALVVIRVETANVDPYGSPWELHL
jgi:hypothetical protein